MESKSRSSKPGRWIKRKDASSFILVAVVSFAASIAAVRLFLEATGYPMIAGGDLHISHVLWGGLFLFVGALAPLVLENRRVYVLSAALSGVGLGLFLDEVGKFITKDYNYHFPAAAPIVYIFFLLTLAVYLRIRHFPGDSIHEQLNEILETIQADLNRPLDREDWADLKMQLTSLASTENAQHEGHLASLLLEYVQGEEHPDIMTPASRLRRARNAVSSWLTEKHLRRLLVAGLLILALIAFKNPAQVAAWMPPGIVNFLKSLTLGGQIPASDAPQFFALRVVLEVVVGFLLLASAALLALRLKNAAVGLGYLALLTTILILDIPVFYFEQFSVIVTVAFQFVVLLGLVDYRRRYPVSLDHTPRPVRIFIKEVERTFALQIPSDG